MKVGDWTMLWLYNSYSISISIRISNELIQLYMGLFIILKKIDYLTYILEVVETGKFTLFS